MVVWQFHIRVRMRPQDVAEGTPVVVSGNTVSTVRPIEPTMDAFTVDFEETESLLARFPRLFIEPDGSFVWSGDDPFVGPWRLNGHLYDRHDRLLYVELNGSSTSFAMAELLDACGCKDRRVLIELVRMGVYLEWEAFRDLMTDGEVN